jgi:hypothetical protein
MSPWNALNLCALALVVPSIFLLSRVRIAAQDEPVAPQAWHALGLALGATLLYLLTPSAIASFDEISYAYATERPGFFYHPNHYLPHIVFRVVYRLREVLNNPSNGLEAARLANAVFAALNAALVYRILAAMTRDAFLAGFLALMFATACWTWGFAVGGEVYPIMMTFVLASAAYFIQMEDRDRWRWSEFWFLSLLLNLAVLSHNAIAVIAAAYAVPIAIRSRKLFARLAVTGTTLFVLLQAVSARLNGFGSIDAWWSHIMFYRAYAAENEVARTPSLKGAFIVLRDGTFTAITGIESAWNAMGTVEKAWTLFLYTAAWVLFGLAVWIAFRNRARWKLIFRKSLSAQVLAGHFGVLALFSMVWSVGNTETLHWLTPFFLALIAMTVTGSPLRPLRIAAAAGGLITIGLSVGTSHANGQKIWKLMHPTPDIRADVGAAGLRPGDVVILTRHREQDLWTRYVLGPVRLRSPIDGRGRLFVMSKALEERWDVYVKVPKRRLNDSVWELDTSTRGASLALPETHEAVEIVPKTEADGLTFADRIPYTLQKWHRGQRANTL